MVTPNKKANTSSMNYYQQLRAAAAGSHRKFLYDTNVGAGLPVIENLQNLLNAGDELVRFSGILSGSLSFILASWMKGCRCRRRLCRPEPMATPSRIRATICPVWTWRASC